MKDNKRAIRRANNERIIKKRLNVISYHYSYSENYIQNLVVGKFSKTCMFTSCSCSMCRSQRKFGHKTLKEDIIDDIFHQEILALKYGESFY